MAFFDLPSDAELAPDARRILEEYRQITGTNEVSATWRTYARHAKVLEARFRAFQALARNADSGFSWQARNVSVMLIAHAKRCQGCFVGARFQLDKLGFDEAVLDGMCANPDALPFQERDRLFVQYTLRIALNSADLQPKDFAEMSAHGFSRDDVQEMIAFAAYWTMNMVFTQSGNAALAEG